MIQEGERRMFKVAAYCRVSTEKSDQVNSLESQKQYFSRYIEEKPDWALTEIYVEDSDKIGRNQKP